MKRLHITLKHIETVTYEMKLNSNKAKPLSALVWRLIYLKEI